MNYRKSKFIFLHVFLLFWLTSQLPATISSQSDTLKLSPDSSKYNLSETYIIPETVTFNCLSGHVLVDSAAINSLNGIISNLKVKSKSILVVQYQFLETSIAQTRLLNPYPPLYMEKDEEATSVRKTKQPVRYRQNLDFLKSGSIYRGVTLASESGVSLQSGLNLELKGNIADNITIRGALSDQNIPIQPEGNTQTLNEIDKVFIELGMGKEAIIFGDYNLVMGTGNYGHYKRKLQGIYAESKRGIATTQIGGAVSKGQYTTNRFNGSEGNQGPYQLTGKDGETAIIVLAGTETVWIDGRQLTRGENNDYVIDYSTGEITFTANQLITAESRITADFQYSNLVYQKNIWYTESNLSVADEKVKISAEFIKESDDKNNPLEINFTDQDKKLLESIGDDIDAGFKSTISADSNGVYILEDSILVYQGDDAGTHSAIFYNVGQAGEYRKIYRANRFYFQWVDKDDPTISQQYKDEAVYLPAKPIKLPTDHKIYHVSAEINPTKTLSVFSEFAQSNVDLNSFSTKDDNDNTGQAYHLDINWQALNTKFGQLTLRTNFNKESDQFQSIDRNHDVEFARKWDLDSDSTQGSQAVESALIYKLKNNLIVDISGASFQRDSFSSSRYKIATKLHYNALTQGEIYEEKIISKSNREWLRRKARAEFSLFNLSPYAGVYYEKKENSLFVQEDFKFLEHQYGIKSSGQFSWQIEQNLRQNDRRDSVAWHAESSAKSLKLSAQLNNWKTISSKITVANRKKKYQNNQSTPDIDFSILSLELRQNPRQLPFTWSTNMKVEKEQSVKKERLYYFVGEGQGQYRYDSTYAEYVPHSQGSYLLRIVPSSIKVPVTNIENDLRFRFNGHRTKNALLKRLSLMSQIRLKQEIKDQSNVLSQWQWHSSNSDTNHTFFYRMISNDLTYRIPQHRINLRLKYRTSLRKSQLDVRGAENSAIDEYSGEYRGPLYGKMKLNARVTLKKTQRISYINASRNKDILALISENEFSYRLNKRHQLTVKVTLSEDRQDKEAQQIEAFLTGLRLEYELRMTRRGRWEFFSEYNNVAVTPAGSILPWEMCQGNQVGNTIGIGATLEYKIGRYIRIRGNYESRSEPFLGLYHRGNIEVRAMF